MITAAGGGELRAQLHGGVEVEQVVVRELLALQHLGLRQRRTHRALDGVEGGLLVRVLAVAEHALAVERGVQRLREVGQGAGGLVDAAEVPGDGTVVRGGVREGLARELEAQPRGHAARGFQLAQHAAVVCGIHHHRHPLVVLGRRADHGRAADVDVLDDLLERGAAGHGLAERVQVHHHQIDGIEAAGPHLLAVGLGRPAQDAAVHARMQGLHPAVEDLRRAREVAHLAHRHARVAQGPGRAPGR
jgi:hypothetical protein